ncbi:hypothetical protein P8452_06912 [Trifolium repens]|nr:hypothetical protein P8452_06912 [Trifolium repens]
MTRIVFGVIYCLAGMEIYVMLRLVFLHLYVLVEGRNCSVEDVGYWSEGVWHWNLSWRCKLLDGISPNVRPRISGFGCWIW